VPAQLYQQGMCANAVFTTGRLDHHFVKYRRGRRKTSSVSLQLLGKFSQPTAKDNTMKTFSRLIAPALATAVAISVSSAAFAAPACTTEAQSKWMPEATIKKMITDQGFTIKTFKVSGSCYEIYGKAKDGKRAEIYYNPVTGKIVKQKLG
jgi:hypothetical protein